MKLSYWSATRLLPISPRKVCFTSYPDVADNAFATFVHIAFPEPDLDMVWLVNDIAGAQARLSRLDSHLTTGTKVIRRSSFTGVYHALTARLYFYTHGFIFFGHPRRGQVVVNLWHGMPLKAIGTFDGKPDAVLPKANFAIATSDFFADVLAEAFATPRERRWVTGQPRNDALGARIRLRCAGGEPLVIKGHASGGEVAVS